MQLISKSHKAFKFFRVFLIFLVNMHGLLLKKELQLLTLLKKTWINQIVNQIKYG